MSLSVVTKQANTFRKRVAEANDGACMYMHHELERMNEINELHAKIEKDVEGMTHKPHVVFVDMESKIAVLIDPIHDRKGLDYKYVSAIYNETRDRWELSSSYWHNVSIAYMHGVAQKQIGMNNQFSLFACRMLQMEPTNPENK